LIAPAHHNDVVVVCEVEPLDGDLSAEYDSIVGQFSPSENTAEQNRNDRSVSLTFERFDVRRLPQSTRFILRTTSFQAGHRASLHA